LAYFAISGLYSMPVATSAALRRGDGDLAVAGAKIEVDVARADHRHGEHALDDLVGRRHPDHVLAGLADVGFVFLSEGRRCNGQREDKQETERGHGFPRRKSAGI
jgi:hypothetical protein